MGGASAKRCFRLSPAEALEPPRATLAVEVRWLAQEVLGATNFDELTRAHLASGERNHEFQRGVG